MVRIVFIVVIAISMFFNVSCTTDCHRGRDELNILIDTSYFVEILFSYEDSTFWCESDKWNEEVLPRVGYISSYVEGRLRKKVDYVRGKFVNDNYYYYSNGKVRVYEYDNPIDITCYGSSYDSLGNLKKEIGDITFHVIFEKNHADTMQLGDTLGLSVAYASPPHLMSNIYFQFYYQDSYNKEWEVLEKKKPYIVFKQILQDTGKYELKIKGEYPKSDSTFLKDVLEYEIDVVEGLGVDYR